MRAALLSCLALMAVCASAQTITTTDVNGNSVIEFITLDPFNNEPLTSTVQTLAPAVTTTSTTPSTTSATTTQDQQGPVGQPAPTGAVTQTVYTYTTTNAAGVTTAIIDTFTPTFFTAQQSPATISGTVLDYSQWLSMIGTNTVPAAQATGGQITLLPSALYGVLAAAVSCVLSGAWLVFDL